MTARVVQAFARPQLGIVPAIIFAFISFHESALAAGALSNGGNFTGTILSATQVDSWTFPASAGDAVTVSISEVGTNTAFHPWIRTYGPDGAQLGNAQGDLWTSSSFTAPLAGTYTVKVARYDATSAGGQYVLTLAESPGTFVVPTGDEGGAINNGANYTGSILRGDLDQWSFAANAGDAVTVSASEVGTNTAFHPWIRTYGPDGKQLGNAQGDLWASSSFSAPLTGTYTVLVARYDAYDGVGQYSLTVAKSPGQFVVPTGDEGGAINNGANYTGSVLRGDLDQWSFVANAGDAVTVSISEVGTNTAFHPWIRTYGPDGKQLGNAQGDLWTNSSFTAPANGTYTVLVARYDASDGVGQYSPTVAKSPGLFVASSGDEGGPMTIGANYTGSILRGDLDQWGFAADVGDAVTVSISEVGTNTAFHPWIRVYGPDGKQLVSAQGDLWAAGSFTAPLEGMYTVLVARYDASDGVGQYALTVAAPPIPFDVPADDDGGKMMNGTSYTGSILRGDLDEWSFFASATRTVAVSIAEPAPNTPFHPWIRVFAPDGTELGSAQGDVSAVVRFFAPQDGTYTVLVARYDSSDGVGQYALSVTQ